MDLANRIKIIRVMNAQVAGITVVNSSAVDLAGYDGCLFIAAFGALTATQVTAIKVQEDTVVGMGTAADLAGSLVGPLADTDGNKCLVVDVTRPRKQFLRCVVNRATANAVIDGVVAILYGAQALPPALDATVKLAEVWASPAEGTA
jgi:hypothetical protein